MLKFDNNSPLAGAMLRHHDKVSFRFYPNPSSPTPTPVGLFLFADVGVPKSVRNVSKGFLWTLHFVIRQ